MVDIHCHILHQIDDGPNDIEESIALCKKAYLGGIDTIVVTPHIYDLSTMPDYLALRELRINELKEALKYEEIEIEVLAGAEVRLSDDVFFVSNLNKLAINHTQYILVEFPFGKIKKEDLVAYIEEVQSFDLIPIVAHPERYLSFQNDREIPYMLSQMGVYFQINANSLLGVFGSNAKRLARELLANNLCFCLASDIHMVDDNANDFHSIMDALSQKLPNDLFERLLYTNPLTVIENRQIRKENTMDLTDDDFLE